MYHVIIRLYAAIAANNDDEDDDTADEDATDDATNNDAADEDGNDSNNESLPRARRSRAVHNAVNYEENSDTESEASDAREDSEDNDAADGIAMEADNEAVAEDDDAMEVDNEADGAAMGADESDESSHDEDSNDIPWYAQGRYQVEGYIFDIDEFMDTFFDSQSSDEFETLRQQEAAEIIPLLPHEAVIECLAMIEGAPKGRDEAHRRQLLISWTQCTRGHIESQCS